MGCGAPTPAKMAADPAWEKLHKSRPVFSRKGSREGGVRRSRVRWRLQTFICAIGRIDPATRLTEV